METTINSIINSSSDQAQYFSSARGWLSNELSLNQPNKLKLISKDEFAMGNTINMTIHSSFTTTILSLG